MKQKKWLAGLLVALLLLTGCSKQQTVVEEGLTLTDMTGQSVTLAQPAERVVALAPSDCEILAAIGAEETLVGRGEYCDKPTEVLTLPSVQSGGETNLEQIIALTPQVVLMGLGGLSEEQIAQLTSAGIAVIVSEANSLDEVYTSIALLGMVTGHETEATAVAKELRQSFASLTEKPLAGGTVYFEVSPLQWGLWTAGAGTFMDEVATLLGLTNCFGDVNGWAEISEEQVLARNPDYIVTISMYYGEGPTPTEEILSRTGWENITAVQKGAVLNLQDNQLSRPTPTLAEGAKLLYDFVKENG